MAVPDEWLYEYAVVRYVPRADRGEYINIGLLMLNKRQKWMKGRIYIDEFKTKSFFPNVDIDILKKQSSLFERQDVPEKEIPIEEKYRWLTAEKSAVIRVSPSHPGIICVSNEDKEKDYKEIMEKEFNRLFKDLVL